MLWNRNHEIGRIEQYIDRLRNFDKRVSKRIINSNLTEGLKRMKFHVTKFNFYFGGSK